MLTSKKYLCFCSLFLCVLIFLLTGCRRREVIWEESAPASFNDEKEAASQNADESAGVTAEYITEKDVYLTVHVCGAVCSPGVYTLKNTARLVDAIEAAGGFTDDADTSWCNQARLISDEEQIRIYTVDETREMALEGQLPEGEAAHSGESAAAGDSLKVNINTATAEQLMQLSGIGKARAEAIIAYRNQNGAFLAIEDIMKVSGIKEALFSRMKDDITV